MSRVTLQSFGAARTVTGSRHLIRTRQMQVLLDCGLFQGHRAESIERNRNIPIDPDAVVLSHAHIDHSGALPSLVRGGYRGPIHATAATADLCEVMLKDVAHINASDARHLNKRRPAGEPKIEPIFSLEDVDRTLRLLVEHEYGEPFEVGPGVRATFRDAGHIIGSAGVLLEIDDGLRVYFTGDIGRRMYPILRDPEPLPDADVILSECTYGTRDHPPAEIAQGQLADAIRGIVRSGGKLMIPAFSVGRTQNLIWALAHDWHKGSLPRIPVYVDSPLAEKATDVIVRHPECYDKELEDFMFEGGRPFYPKGVRYVESRDESISLNQKRGPFVVIAGSGMCEGGRIVHHLKHNLADEKNAVLFVGWCAPYTLGRRILEHRSPVRILGKQIPIKAQISKINAYSAHAGRSDLIEFLAPAQEMGASIYLVHGDEDTAIAFADTLRAGGHHSVTIPETYAKYELVSRMTPVDDQALSRKSSS